MLDGQTSLGLNKLKADKNKVSQPPSEEACRTRNKCPCVANLPSLSISEFDDLLIGQQRSQSIYFSTSSTLQVDQSIMFCVSVFSDIYLNVQFNQNKNFYLSALLTLATTQYIFKYNWNAISFQPVMATQKISGLSRTVDYLCCIFFMGCFQMKCIKCSLWWIGLSPFFPK